MDDRKLTPAQRMREIPVLYEDAWVIAFDKPAGLLIAPDRWDKSRPNLMDAVHQSLGFSVNNAHRLDGPTSGVLLCAKDRETLRHLVRQFGQRLVAKTYRAIVKGSPAFDQTTIESPITDDPRRPGRMRIDPKRGKPAVTRAQVLERFFGYALVECLPETGRTHQIRVHLASVGCPCVADSFYGEDTSLLLSRIKRDYRPKPGQIERPILGRLGLHASRLEFAHPGLAEKMAVEAPDPKDFSVTLRNLRRFASRP